MKRFQIDANFVSEMVMGFIMIPFLLVAVLFIGFSLLLFFPYWKIKNRRKR